MDMASVPDGNSQPLAMDLDANCASLKIVKPTYLRILEKALKQTREDILKFESALTEGDFNLLAEISHRLKGDYANMRIEGLSAIAHRMNEISINEKNTEQLSRLLKQFKGGFEQLQGLVQESQQGEKEL